MQVSNTSQRDKQSVSRRRSSEPSIADVPLAIRLDLQSHSFFSQLPESVLERLLRRIHLQRFAPGDLLIREGTLGKALFLVIKGVAEVLLEQSEVVLAELHRGSFFGEIGLFYGVRRTATVRARTILTVAMLTRREALEVLRDEPNAFRSMVAEAQKRYRQTRPPTLATGHAATPHYIMMQLRMHYQQFVDYEEKYLLQLIRQSWYRSEPPRTIVAFMRGEQSKETVLLVLSGRVTLRDEVNNIQESHGPGGVVAFPPHAHPLAHVIADEETSTLVVLKKVYLAALERAPLPPIEDVFEGMSHAVVASSVNLVGEALGGAVRRRRNTVDNVFWHDQTPHQVSRQPPLPPDTKRSEMSRDLAQLPDVAALQALLSLYDIASEDPSRILPMLDARYVDLGTVSAKITDGLMKSIVEAFGSEWRVLVLCGFSLTDASLEHIAPFAKNLTELHIQDCMLFSTEALAMLMSSCSNMKSLHVKNCPGFTERCLKCLEHSGARPECLELSFLRNLGHDGWSAVCLFASSLRSLTLHRIIQLGEENIRSVNETTSFQHLKLLDLSESAFITTNGLRAMLARMPVLMELRLSFCTGLDETLAKAVPADCAVAILDLSYCSRAVTDRSMAALLPKLPCLKTFVARNLKHPTKAMLDELLNMPHLKQVDLAGCPLIASEEFNEAAQRGGWNS